VLGAGGFLGRALLAAYRASHGDVIATTRTGQPTGLGQSSNVFKLDLARPDLTALHLVEQGYTDVIISGAMTSIGRCEREPKGAWASNCDGPLAIARQLASRGVKTIVFSSDYVFRGEKGGYEDDAPTAPQNVYGQTKAELERRLPEVCGNNWLVIRLSKVFDTHRGDGTLLDEMAAKLTSGQEIAVAHDQVFCPTHVHDVGPSNGENVRHREPLLAAGVGAVGARHGDGRRTRRRQAPRASHFARRSRRVVRASEAHGYALQEVESGRADAFCVDG
jgi:dTDP-4-dehydrorhamnose reductase